jgi:cation transport regulator ChaB
MEDIESNATAELRNIPKEAFRRCFQQWQDPWSKREREREREGAHALAQ